jgi:predicted nicotinamide N-methyase
MPGYLTKQESIAVAGVPDITIRSLLDRQQYADPTGAAVRMGISSAAWPLFGLLWPSGAELAARLALHPVVLGERILEIGCGLGLSSLVGHRRGADVTASDCHPLAASFLAENLRLNGLSAMKYRLGHWGGQDCSSAQSLSKRLGPFPDDGSVPVSGYFDLIVGSDVLYERDEQGALANYINSHAAPQAQVWIVDPHRGNRPAFSRHMISFGFDMVEERLDRVATLVREAYRGRLLRYWRTHP